MLSRQQFNKASGFLATYQDALKTVEQIAEQRQSYSHYEKASGDLVDGMQNNQVSMQNTSAVGGANKADFVYVRANEHAQSVYNTFQLGQADSRDDFVKRLNGAMEKMSEGKQDDILK